MSETSEIPILEQRKDYYIRKASEYLDKYPSTFKEFVQNEEVIKYGDEILSRRLSSGYNVSNFNQFPLNSGESLIFYSVYVQRKEHFGELLAKMEQKKIIKEDDITFGITATKIIGEYGDPEPALGQIQMKDGEIQRTMESVEGIIIFKPTTPEQAEEAAIFLLEEAPKIPGGYIEPNTRATATPLLVERLAEGNGFKIAIANVYRFDDQNIIALKKETKFKYSQQLQDKERWNDFKNLLNPELYEYLTYAGVEP